MSVYIQHKNSGLVLDGANEVVVLNNNIGACCQKWNLIAQPDGSHLIQNVKTGQFLDLRGSEPGGDVITYQKTENPNQRWFISNESTIGNGVKSNIVLDVCRSDFKVGGKIIGYKRHNKQNQLFVLIPAC